MNRFVFKHRGTGELREAPMFRSLNLARRSLGIEADPAWVVWEWWDGRECVWHYTDDGEIHTGPRPPQNDG